MPPWGLVRGIERYIACPSRNIASLPSHMKQLAASLIDQPELIDCAITFYDRVLSLATLPEDAPEIVQLAEECLHDPNLQPFLMLFLNVCLLFLAGMLALLWLLPSLPVLAL